MAVDKNQVFNLHINLLQVIENELGRLHANLNIGAGDEDTTQEQISNLHEELSRLSESLNEIEATLITVE